MLLFTVERVSGTLSSHTRSFYLPLLSPPPSFLPVYHHLQCIIPDSYHLQFSCANMPFGFFNSYGHAANQTEQIDFATHLGDYSYEYSEGTCNILEALYVILALVAGPKASPVVETSPCRRRRQPAEFHRDWNCIRSQLTCSVPFRSLRVWLEHR